MMGETISFAPRKAIKSQVLANFVAEWVDTQLPTAPIQPVLWTMFFCNAPNFAVEFFLFFTRQIRALPFLFLFALARP
jgi:hypothetical protein